MGYRLLATAALAVHFCYPVYVILGGFLAWRWPKMIWPHLVACVWALLIVAQWVNCPLTWVENWAREKSGQTRLTNSFSAAGTCSFHDHGQPDNPNLKGTITIR